MINCGILGYGKMGKIRHSAVKACGTKIKVTKIFDVVKPDNLDPEVCFCENEKDILKIRTFTPFSSAHPTSESQNYVLLG